MPWYLDPDDFCPICGIRLVGDHRCRPTRLAAIDEAHRLAAEREPGHDMEEPTWSDRLRDGVYAHQYMAGGGEIAYFWHARRSGDNDRYLVARCANVPTLDCHYYVRGDVDPDLFRRVGRDQGDDDYFSYGEPIDLDSPDLVDFMDFGN